MNALLFPSPITNEKSMLKVWKEVKMVCALAGFKYLGRDDFAFAKRLFKAGKKPREIANRVLDSIYGLDKSYDC
jgi:hypothetical protein